MSPERSLTEAIATLAGLAWVGVMIWLSRRGQNGK